MADQVEIEIPKTRINEGGQFIATARFRTRASAAAATPTNVYCKISNLSTGKVVRDWASISASSEVSITVTPTENTIDDNTHLMERMEFLVASDYGLSTQVIGSRHYQITNLEGYG